MVMGCAMEHHVLGIKLHRCHVENCFMRETRPYYDGNLSQSIQQQFYNEIQ